MDPGRAPPLPGGGGRWPPAGTRKLRKSVFLLIFIFEKQCEWRSHRKMLELSSWRNMQFLNWKSIFSKYTIKYIKKSKNSAEYLKYAKYQLKKWLKSQNQWVFFSRSISFSLILCLKVSLPIWLLFKLMWFI
jgi:hypothetical protein